MDNRGASPLKMVLIAAAVLTAILLVFMGQIGIALVLLAVAVIVGVTALFSRAKTPTD